MNTHCFFAFAKGKVSEEASRSFRLYTGFVPVNVVAVNPTKAELEKIYSRTLEKDVEYTGKTKEGIEQARIDFVVKADPNYCTDVNLTTRISFFINNEPRKNRDGSKVQVIDKFGRTAWVTKEEYQAKSLPAYMKHPYGLDKDYRIAFTGEEELIRFIKAFLCIKGPEKWANSKVIGVAEGKEAEDYLVGFEDISSFFKGNFTEIKEAIELQPNNTVRVLFGVRTTNDNKQYQAFYNKSFVPMDVDRLKAYRRIEAELTAAKNAGSFPTTEFVCEDVQEYVNRPTDFSKKEEDDDDLPFGNNDNPWA